jgi:hypothetical protein
MSMLDDEGKDGEYLVLNVDIESGMRIKNPLNCQ